MRYNDIPWKNISFILFVILILIHNVSAATLTVDDSGSADFIKILDAINEASNGDTILVYSGTYSESLNISKQLFLQGIDNGGGKPVIEGDGSGNAIDIIAGKVILEGFYVTSNTGLFNWRINQGIRIYSNDNIIKNNVILYNNHGIRLFNSSNNTIIGNTVLNNEYHGMRLYNSSNNTFINNTASENKHQGFNLIYSDNNKLIGNTISNNINSINFNNSNNNEIYNNNFINNRVSDSSVNSWDSGYPTGGNYYSDYSGTDANNDGIGDTPYRINRRTNDSYPLMIPYGGTIGTDIFSDDFSASALSSEWIVINKNSDSNISLTGTGILRMNASPMNGGESDYFNRSKINTLMILKSRSKFNYLIGDGIFETKIDFSPTNNYQNAGIIMCPEENQDTETCIVAAERGFFLDEGGSVVSSTGPRVNYTNSITYLRIMLKGMNYSGWYSSDGVNWILNDQNTSDLIPKMKYVGLFVIRQPWDGNEGVYSEANFDYFKITPLSLMPGSTPMPEITQTQDSLLDIIFIILIIIFIGLAINKAIDIFFHIIFKTAKKLRNNNLVLKSIESTNAVVVQKYILYGWKIEKNSLLMAFIDIIGQTRKICSKIDRAFISKILIVTIAFFYLSKGIIIFLIIIIIIYFVINKVTYIFFHIIFKTAKKLRNNNLVLKSIESTNAVVVQKYILYGWKILKNSLSMAFIDIIGQTRKICSKIDRAFISKILIVTIAFFYLAKVITMIEFFTISLLIKAIAYLIPSTFKDPKRANIIKEDKQIMKQINGPIIKIENKELNKNRLKEKLIESRKSGITKTADFFSIIFKDSKRKRDNQIIIKIDKLVSELKNKDLSKEILKEKLINLEKDLR